MAKICSVDGCNNKYHAKGFCKIHYNKLRLYGDPLYTTSSELKSKRISQKLKGKPKSESHKKNLSKAMIGRTPWNKGIPQPDETKRKQREKMKGRPSPRKDKLHTITSRIKMSKAHLGRKDSPKTKLIKSIAHNKPETLALSRLRGLEVQSRPEVKEKQRTSLKITYNTPEGREMQRQRRYAMTSSPESKDERLVQEFLTKNNIEFQSHPKISLPKPKRYHQPDILVKPNKIIAVNGDRYHANPMFYLPDDIINGIRDGSVRAGDLQKEDELIWKMLKDLGFEILVLWEYEFGSRRKPKITKDIERKIFDFLEL